MLMGMIFPSIAFLSWKIGEKKVKEQIHILETGKAVKGHVSDVQIKLDESQNPFWILTYSFEAESNAYSKSITSSNAVLGMRKAGDDIWIVYLLSDPEKNTIWPPILQ